MIDPTDLPKYNMPQTWLEEFLLFCVCVAGKNATTTSRCLDRFLNSLQGETPFEKIRNSFDKNQDVATFLKNFGLGCYNHRTKTFKELVYSNLDLNKCWTKELEQYFGIGQKTSRYFLLHTRKNAQIACLDTHILKYLRDLGYDVPKHTPTGKKYLQIEKELLTLAEKAGKSIADFDLEIWLKYSGRKK